MTDDPINPHNNPNIDVMQIRTFLTAISVFMMGIIDSYAVIVHGMLVSAQTGNLVTISRELVSRDLAGISRHITVFFAFCVGSFFGKLAQEILRKSWHRFRYYILFQTSLLLVLAIFQTSMNQTVLVQLLAMLSGYGMALFRNFRETRANNGIMTGNTKAMMSNLFVGFYKKDKGALIEAFNLFLVIIIFVSGVCVGSVLVIINPILSLWVSFALMLLSMIWLTYLNKKANKSLK